MAVYMSKQPTTLFELILQQLPWLDWWSRDISIYTRHIEYKLDALMLFECWIPNFFGCIQICWWRRILYIQRHNGNIMVSSTREQYHKYFIMIIIIIIIMSCIHVIMKMMCNGFLHIVIIIIVYMVYTNDEENVCLNIWYVNNVPPQMTIITILQLYKSFISYYYCRRHLHCCQFTYAIHVTFVQCTQTRMDWDWDELWH